MIYAIIGKPKLDKLFESLNKIQNEETHNHSSSYDNPFFEEFAKSNQDEYNQHLDESKEKANGFTSSITGKQVEILRKKLVLMDKENWDRYKDAKVFLHNYFSDKLGMLEKDFNLHRIYRMETSHLHCLHG